MIAVKDTGVGIPEPKLKAIFQSFEQASYLTSDQYGGTGLGLSICKGFADMMGGSIEVKSEEGKGSEFTVRLQVQTPSEAEIREFVDRERPRRIKKVLHSKNRSSIVIGLTSSQGAGASEEAEQVGMRELIRKPILFKDLLQKVDEWCQ